MAYVDSVAPDMNYPESLCVYHHLARQSELTPKAIAITAPGRPPLTYRHLCRHIAAVVGMLNTMGVGRNNRIAMVIPDGPEMAVAFLAVASAATSAPLNSAYSSNEFDFYLSDLNVKALIVQVVCLSGTFCAPNL